MDFNGASSVRSAVAVSVLEREPSVVYSQLGKRLIDVALVVLAAPVALPLIGLILLSVWLEGGCPLYRQSRVGVGGKEFSCWKIRTMVRNADSVLRALIETDPAIAAEWHENQKLARDPRITRVGRFLRRTSLDELPQLWNVLNGTMSLIGPRPFMPNQQGLYAGGRTSAAYYTLRPGISGLWQVSRRNAGSFAERVYYDEEYSRSVSLYEDARILWQTFSVVLRATGV